MIIIMLQLAVSCCHTLGGKECHSSNYFNAIDSIAAGFEPETRCQCRRKWVVS